MNRREVQMLTFSQHGDERGHLVVVEGEQDIPFVVKRIFYMYGSDRNVVRGQHANRRSEFVLINVSGTLSAQNGLEGHVRFFARLHPAGFVQRALRRGGIHPRSR